MREWDKKRLLILLLILCMGIGFSFLTSTLTITGNTSVSGNKWSIYFDNIQVLDGSIEADEPKVDTNKTTVNFSVLLDKPGDFYEFTVDAINDGTIDAMIDSVVKTEIEEDYLKFLSYTVMYEDESEIKKEDLLKVGGRNTYKIKVEYKKDIQETDLLNTDLNLNLSFTVNYVQSTIKNNTNAKYGLMWSFDYTGEEEAITIPSDGAYKLEVWGAQGGSTQNGYTYPEGGYGSYSVGTINLDKEDTLYINVGGKATDVNKTVAGTAGGYNGGGSGGTGMDSRYPGGAGGGGATHIALDSGLLQSLSAHATDNRILIVAGGGGGAIAHISDLSYPGGHAGGMSGNAGSRLSTSSNVAGGTQTTGYAFGKGQNGKNGDGADWGQTGRGGGGGGYYGGYASQVGTRGAASGGGGSGYIGNENLTNKAMYCYECSEPDTTDENYENIKTISTTNVSDNPVEQYAKKGNGYAKITYMGESDININLRKSSNSVDVNNINFNTETGLISFETTLTGKENYAEIVLELENVSNKDYYISKLLKNNYDNSKISYTVTYSDLSDVSKKDIFRKNSKETIIIKVQLLEDNDELNNESFSLKIKHEEAKDTEIYNRDYWIFDYTGKEDTLMVEKAGIYKLEVWGAQGGDIDSTYLGGYGGYTTGKIILNKEDELYINVGGAGQDNCNYNYCTGGYNGGGRGSGSSHPVYSAGGGGATHIATVSGLLKDLSSHQNTGGENISNEILIVAGGGGGASEQPNSASGSGGSGGGYIGNTGTYTLEGWYGGTGGTQLSYGTAPNSSRGTNGSFGLGGNGTQYSAGGGGGYYGGGASNQAGGGGGSGYIGNTKLNNKAMYCYNCSESDEESTKTISTTNVSQTPTSNYAKKGNGYAKITYIGKTE